MRIYLFLPFAVLLSILSASCTKEVKYTKEDLLALAQSSDPSFTVILPKNMNEGIHCADYSEGCLSGHTVQVKNLEFIAVEFTTQDQAIYAAKKYRGYYLGNWFLDDVSGEPVLEKFVTEKLKAQKP